MDPFAELVRSGDPAADVQRFYKAVGLPDTLAHVQQVAVEARGLAVRHGVDVDVANLAALSHDLGAAVPVTERVAVAGRMGVEVGEADRALPMLLHGPIAAAALAERLAVQNQDVLNAVRYHSTLRAGASALEKIVFVADKIAYDPRSPHRGEYVPALLAAESLDGAALAYLNFLLDNNWRYGWHLHPNAIAAWRQLTKGAGR